MYLMVAIQHGSEGMVELETRHMWVSKASLPLSTGGTLGKFLDPTEPLCPPVSNDDRADLANV